jgi:hypothetical protein
VRGVQKMLDVGRHGVIEFGHYLVRGPRPCRDLRFPQR